MGTPSSRFDGFILRLLDHEGGYVNDPNDPGGETKYGISKRSYPNVDIKNLTFDEAALIYFHDFWCIIGGDTMYDGVAWQLLDFAVNSGIHTAIRKWQQAIGVADDGYVGPVTFRRARDISESDQIMLILAKRLKYLALLSGWDRYGRGWVRRVAKNLEYGAEDS